MVYCGEICNCVAAATNRFHPVRETMFDNSNRSFVAHAAQYQWPGALLKTTLLKRRCAKCAWLLEADAALPVVSSSTRKRESGWLAKHKSPTPWQEFVKIVRSELVAAMGEENQTLNLAARSRQP